MAPRYKNSFWNYMPYLNLYICVPFLTVRTALMYKQLESATIEYLLLYVKLYKWDFEFRLYDTFRRIEDRYLQS